MRHIFIVLLIGNITITDLWGEPDRWHGKDRATLAVFKDPVTDLFVDRTVAKNIPTSPPGVTRAGLCPRAHQALYNEVVTCVEWHHVHDEHVKVSFDNVVYGHDPVTGEPRSSFWTTTDRLIFLKDMTDECIDALPGPRFERNEPMGSEHTESETVVLTLPWKRYSVATRFVRVPEHDTSDGYGVKLLDMGKKKITHMVVPHAVARLEEAVSLQEARKLFVENVNQLVDHFARKPSQKVVPYIWGGSSCVDGYEDCFTANAQGAWVRKGRNQPYMGYDCSELVLRLAQVSGLPYVYKTTLTLAERGRALTKDDTIEAGDLLWIPGHVLIVGDVASNNLIESRSYSSGYGKLQRLALRDCFAGIKTFGQLRDAFFAKKRLTRLKKGGLIESVLPEFKIIKIC